MNIKNCNICNKELSSKTKGDYCLKCFRKPLIEKNFQEWLDNGDLGISVGTTLRGYMRILVQEYYGNNCSICGIKPIWEGKDLVLILDHIDGDASNNVKENLRFVCPNCDSQLDTYKSKNKNSARRKRNV